MESLTAAFQPLCQEVQTELKKYLSGLLTAGFIKPYLPQHWLFITEHEEIIFSVDKKGNAAVSQNSGQSPDVTIKIDHDFLVEAIRSRKKPEGEPDTFEVSFQTEKGKTAFGYLRKHLGL